MKRVLIIGYIWPEPTSSAAGTRMLQLIRYFLHQSYQVHLASAASRNAHSFAFSGWGVHQHSIQLNDEQFNEFIKELRPEVVLFDRFMSEEQYGWRVDQECPEAVKILDTEDLHFLRYARADAFKHKSPQLNLHTDTAKREIAAILRCDLSLIISRYEMKLLEESFRIPAEKLQYLPFITPPLNPLAMSRWPGFHERKDFVFIGNYLHAPNLETVRLIKTKYWSLLRGKLPQARMHIYGAYDEKIKQLHNPKEGFLVQGRAPDAVAVLQGYRVLLAPIPFGAGLKGKFIDAMRAGTPSVTTPIGAEGLVDDSDWCGAIESNIDVFAQAAADLYQNESRWKAAQERGVNLINQAQNGQGELAELTIRLKLLLEKLSDFRQNHFIGEILKFHTLNSFRYMSLWIQEKSS